MANRSQEKRQRMLALLNTIKEAYKDDDEMLLALGEIENELNSKKYGLVWEKHEEEVDRMMQDNIPVFTEVKEREIKATDENAYNFLLEGDNLHSLKLLEKTHAGKIDVIYIDIIIVKGLKWEALLEKRGNLFQRTDIICGIA